MAKANTSNKNQRTPIIMPRKQGGTFYTFGSAMEDIGLNINEGLNKVELSHYVLLEIPEFCGVDGSDASDFSLVFGDNWNTYDSSGDFAFAENFQDYCLNMETVLRNQGTYNYASNKTVSERVFWKWLFKHIQCGDTDSSLFDSSVFGDASLYWEKSEGRNTITKGFGLIGAGSQRTDDSGIYNETFVQIPSSYGQSVVFFRKTKDENYMDSSYLGTTETYIENIDPSTECYSSGDLRATGISGKFISDYKDSNKAGYSISMNHNYDKFEVVLDLPTLNLIYGSNGSLITYDDIAMGHVANSDYSVGGDFSFNAILVYYSIYNSDKSKLLSTNAYGLYILDSAIKTENSYFRFPSLLKTKTTSDKNGTSYSFRLNIKPSSAYSGDIEIADNSTPSFAMSEDFNDVIRNLTAATRILKSNSKVLSQVVKDNETIKEFATNVMEKTDEIEQTLTNIQNGNYPYTADAIFKSEEENIAQQISYADAVSILKDVSIGYDIESGKPQFKVGDASLNSDQSLILSGITTEMHGVKYIDTMGLLAIITSVVQNLQSFHESDSI